MGDRDGRRQRHPRRIVGTGGGTRHHLPDLIAGEPARLGELLGVDGDLLGQGLGKKPHHQARRERPRLRGQVAHAPAANARRPAYLTPHGLLRRFTRLDEAGGAGQPAARAPAARGETGREPHGAVAEAEKDRGRPGVDLIAPRRPWLPIERGNRRAASERLQVAQRQEARLRVAEQLRDPLAVIPALAGPIQRVAAEAVDVVHVGGYVWSTLTDRPVAEDRSIASTSLWRWTARLKSTSKDPLPRRASAARA